MALEQGEIKGPTPEEIDRANRGVLPGRTERVLNWIANRTSLKLFIAADSAIASYAIYHNVPEVHEQVDTHFLSHLRGDSISQVSIETSTVKPNEVFDNNAKKMAIGPNNMHIIGSDNRDQFYLESVIDNETQSINFPFPFKIDENTTGTIERINLADLSPNTRDPSKHPPVALIDFKFDDIVSIVAPEDSHMYLIRGIEDWGQDPNRAGQVWFYKYYEEKDTTVAWRFTDNNPTKLGNFNNLLPIQDFDKEKLRGTGYENLPEVDSLTEVMTTTEPNQPVRLSLMAYKGKDVGSVAAIAGADFLLRPQFSTFSSDGTEKLLAFKK